MIYSEYFYSIQGEGSLMGVPSVFFRFSGCNLRCWFCDSDYTSFRPENKKMTVEEAVEKIVAFGANHIVITGGEPYVQRDELIDLCRSLKEANPIFHITIETNGTFFFETETDLISLSPKLSLTGPLKNQANERWQKKHERDRLNYETLRSFVGSTKHDYQFKFVVSLPLHIEEIDMLQEDLGIPSSKVYLMPEGQTTDELAKRQVWVAETCMANGWRYSDRLHVRFWEDKRGV